MCFAPCVMGWKMSEAHRQSNFQSFSDRWLMVFYACFVLFFKSLPALKSSWRPGSFGNPAENLSAIFGARIRCRKSFVYTFKGHMETLEIEPDYGKMQS